MLDNVDEALATVAIADMYNVRKLLDFAVHYVRTSLCIQKVLDIIVVADQHSLRELERVAIRFACAYRERLYMHANNQGFKSYMSAFGRLFDCLLRN